MMRRGFRAISIWLMITGCHPTHAPALKASATKLDAVSALASSSSLATSSNSQFVGPNAPTHLRDSDKQALARWQHALVKRCDARAALGIIEGDAHNLDGQGGAIDVALLHERLQQDTRDAIPTLVTPKERVIFGSPQLSPHTSTSIWQAGNMPVTATLEHSVCTLRLYDTVIYRALLATQVPIEARLPAYKCNSTSRTRTYKAHPVGASHVGVQGQGLWDVVQNAMRPNDATTAHVAKHLGIPQATAHRLFERQPNFSFGTAMQVMHGDKIPWFSRATPEVIGTAEDIATLFSRNDLRTRLHLVMRTTPWPTLQMARAPRTAWLTVEAAVRIGPRPGPRPASDIQLESLQVAPPTWVGSYTGTQCLQDRAAMLLGSRDTTAPITPAWAHVAEPCAVFDDQARPQGYTDGVYMDLLPRVMRHIDPGPQVDWRGWDAVLLRIASDLQRNQQDIAQTLDPHGQAPAIDRLGESWANLHAVIATYPHLQNERPAIAHMIGMQALHGHIADAIRLDGMLSAMDRAFDAFPEAARRWVAQLEQRDMLQDSTFSTVQHMTPAYIQQAHAAADVAARYDDRQFRDHVYDAILQTHPTMHTLQSYIDTTRRRHAIER